MDFVQVGAVIKLGFPSWDGQVRDGQVGVFKWRCAGRGVVDFLVSILD
jgi:hypothetical protein